MSESVVSRTTLAELSRRAEMPEAPSIVSIFNAESFRNIQEVGNWIANSTIIPPMYQKNGANCFIALNIANRIDADPFMVMQNLYIINGMPSWSSKFLIATFNKSKRYTPIRFRFEGTPGQDNYGCRAVAIDRETSEELVGSLISVGMAKANGWYNRPNSAWPKLTEQMLQYRAASLFIKIYAPEISLGMATEEEAFDAVAGPDGVYRINSDAIFNSPENNVIEGETEPATEPAKKATEKAANADKTPAVKTEPAKAEPAKTNGTNGAVNSNSNNGAALFSEPPSAKAIVSTYAIHNHMAIGDIVAKFTPNKSLKDYTEDDWISLGRDLKIPELT